MDGNIGGSPRRRSKPLLFIAGAVGIVVVGVLVWSAMRTDERGTSTLVANGSVTPETSPAPDTSPLTLGPPGAPLPDVSVDDFNVTLRIVKDTCLDSGSARVTVQPEVEYTGPDLNGRAWLLTYEVQGIAAEPQTIASQDGHITTTPLTLSTPTCHAALGAMATGIIVN